MANDLLENISAFKGRHIWEVSGKGPAALQEVEPEDILHVHSCASWAEFLAKTDSRARLAITVHDCSLFTGGCVFPLDCDLWKTGCKSCKRGIPGADKAAAAKKELVAARKPLLVAPSAWMGAMLKEVWPGLDVRIIPNGVAWEEDIPGFRTRLPVLLFVAHSGESAVYKGGDRWMGVYQKIRDMFPDIRAYFVGGRKHEKKGDIQCLPLLPNSELRRLMRQCRMLVYPSLGDNHPLIVLEAMACGLPVAATAAGGIPEQIEHGRTGILARDCRDLPRAAAGALKKPADMAKMSHRAWREGSKRFNVQRMAAAYEKVYASLHTGT